jgi:hypothetical protein
MQRVFLYLLTLDLVLVRPSLLATDMGGPAGISFSFFFVGLGGGR